MNIDFSELHPKDQVIELLAEIEGLEEKIERMRNCKNCKLGWSTEECIMPEGECIGRSEWVWMDEED